MKNHKTNMFISNISMKAFPRQQSATIFKKINELTKKSVVLIYEVTSCN